MPAIETACRFQTAVLWNRTGYDDYGNPTLASPVEIGVRWETGRVESLDAQNNNIGAESLAVVDREVAVGSIIWKGKLSALPEPTEELRQVIEYRETPDLKNRHIRRVILLARYSESLPGAS